MDDSFGRRFGVVHAPDGFLNAATSVGTGAVSVGAIGATLRFAKDSLDDRRIPLAGLAAAFVFAAQMINFPVAAGTSGHLLGGALAAILLGPAIGSLVVTVVVVVQALLFADGGLTALGYNVLNMAIIPAWGGWAVYRFARPVMGRGATSITGATFVAAAVSVVLSAAAFAVQFAIGGTATNVPVGTVFAAMVGVHVLIGIGEGVISALTVRAVLASRPDLVAGADGLDIADARAAKIPTRGFVLAGAIVSLVVAIGVSQFASSSPDGLESVAESQGFSETAEDSALADSPLADYGFSGTDNDVLGLALAGGFGVLATLGIGYGLFRMVGRRRSADAPA